MLLQQQKIITQSNRQAGERCRTSCPDDIKHDATTQVASQHDSPIADVMAVKHSSNGRRSRSVSARDCHLAINGGM